MISGKSDFKFVSENALKNISIEGAPYPVRNQKLVLLGEDVAFLQEALKERNAFTGGEVDNQAKLPDNFYADKDEKYWNVRAFLSVVGGRYQYDTRIRKIDLAFADDMYNAVRNKLEAGGWIDKGKAAEVPAAQNPVFKCTGPDREVSDDSPEGQEGGESGGEGSSSGSSGGQGGESGGEGSSSGSSGGQGGESGGEGSSGSSEEGQQEGEGTEEEKPSSLSGILAKYSKELKDAKDGYEEGLRLLNDAYEQNVKNENDSYKSGNSELAAAETAYEEAKTAAYGTYTAAKAAENRRHDSAAASDEEKRRHDLEMQKIYNAYMKDLTSAEEEYVGKNARIKARHFKTLKRLKDELDKAVKRKTLAYNERVSGLEDARDEAVTSFCEDKPYLFSDVVQNGVPLYCKAWRSREEAFSKAVIDRSCADKFYATKFVIHPSSTVLDRVYADLERMDDSFSIGINFRDLWRDTYTVGSNTFYAKNCSEGGSTTIRLAYDGEDVSPSSSKFFLYFGTRYSIDLVKEIKADAVLSRWDFVSHAAERSETTREGVSKAVGIMSAVAGGRLEYYKHWVFSEDLDHSDPSAPDVYDRVVVYEDKLGNDFTQEDKDQISQAVKDACKALDDADKKAAKITDEESRAVYVVRVTFTKDDDNPIPNEEKYARIDAISDALEEERKKLVKTRDDNLKESRLQYQQDMRNAEAAYNEAVAAAERERSEAKRQAAESIVNGWSELALGINSRIKAAETDDEKNDIINDELYPALIDAANALRQQIAEADYAYEQALEGALRARHDAESTALRGEDGNGGRTGRDKAINKKFDTDFGAKRESATTEAWGIYCEIVDARNSVWKTYRDALSEAKQTYDNAEHEGFVAADEYMREKHGPSSDETHNYYHGWFWGKDVRRGEAYYGIRVGYDDDYGSGIGEDALYATYSLYRAVESPAAEEYAKASADAEAARDAALAKIVDMRLYARGKFVTTISVDDSGGLSGEKVSKRVDLVQLRNVEYIFEPRTLTGADFSKYYEELDRDKENEALDGDSDGEGQEGEGAQS